MRVYARAVKRRARLSGEHGREFDKALEWAQMGTNDGPYPVDGLNVGVAHAVETCAPISK